MFFLAAVLLCGCGNHGGSASSGPATAPSVREFPMFRIPSMYTDPYDRMVYAAEHYWDAFLSTDSVWPCDSLTINGVPAETVEEHFATYVELLIQLLSMPAGQTDVAASVSVVSDARKGISSLFRHVEAKQKSDSLSNVFDRFASLAEKYLYDPNSPYRNEDLYLPYVQGLAVSLLTDPLMVPAYSHDAEMCAMNSVGSKVPDFVFKDIDGGSHSLYGVKGTFTLLFFSNPGCEACKQIIETIKSDIGLEHLISSGKLAVVNVYIDEDIDAWKSYQDYYPDTWFNGYDPSYSIRQDVKYNVRAIPSLYLLDSEKRVIMKDAPENRVFAYLNAAVR